MQKDISSDLLQIREQFAAGMKIDNLESPKLDPELLTLIDHVRSDLEPVVELEATELLIIAALFDPDSSLERLRLGRYHIQPLLTKIFANTVPIANRLAYIPKLTDRGLLLSDKYCGQLEPEVARTYGFAGIAHLYNDKVRLSCFARALILGDETTLRFYSGAPYHSNIEFLNDWAELLELARCSSTGHWDDFDDRVSNMMLGYRARREYDRIIRRLAATKISVPFRTIAEKYALDFREQVALMHTLYQFGCEDSAGERLEDPLLLMEGESFYVLQRPLLSPNSRLVKLGLFVVEKVAFGLEIRDELKLSQDVYKSILGDAAWIASRPVVE
jgi:hypothetical protein